MPLEFMYSRPLKSSTTPRVRSPLARPYASIRAASLAAVTSPAISITLSARTGVRTVSATVVPSSCSSFRRRRAPASSARMDMKSDRRVISKISR